MAGGQRPRSRAGRVRRQAPDPRGLRRPERLPGQGHVPAARRQARSPTTSAWAAAAVFCPDEATANAIQGGTRVVDGEVFWHPFQVRFHEWLKKNARRPRREALRKDLEVHLQRLAAAGDQRRPRLGVVGELGLRHGLLRLRHLPARLGPDAARRRAPGGQGHHPGRPDHGRRPPELRDAHREGQRQRLLADQRRAVVLPPRHRRRDPEGALRDLLAALDHRGLGPRLRPEQVRRFAGALRPRHALRLVHHGQLEADRQHVGQEGGGILGDATDDPRFQKVMDRYHELYSYLYCREAGGAAVAANPWSSRTHMSPHQAAANWENDAAPLEGRAGPRPDRQRQRRRRVVRRAAQGLLRPDLPRPPGARSGSASASRASSASAAAPSASSPCPARAPSWPARCTSPTARAWTRRSGRTSTVHSLVGERWDGSPLVAAHQRARGRPAQRQHRHQLRRDPQRPRQVRRAATPTTPTRSTAPCSWPSPTTPG